VLLIATEVGNRPPAASRVVHRLNRSKLLSLSLALAFPLLMIREGHLLSSPQLQRIFEMPMDRFGGFSLPIFSLVHGRPLEVCPSIADDEANRSARLRERHQAVAGIRDWLAMAVAYHQTSRELMFRRAAISTPSLLVMRRSPGFSSGWAGVKCSSGCSC
jgi:hypothetical protein